MAPIRTPHAQAENRNGVSTIQPGETILRVNKCIKRPIGVRESLAIAVGLLASEDKQRALAALEQVGIENKANNRADALSGGQQQRVGIARVLMQEPRIILADEPVASLDPVLAHSILQYLEMMNKRDKTTVICSLHFLDLVHRYGTHVVGLKDGIKVFEGKPAEINREKFKEIYGEEAQEVRATCCRVTWKINRYTQNHGSTPCCLRFCPDSDRCSRRISNVVWQYSH